ncbi:complex I intermediate-associated protein CIA30 [Hymenopellis radicata]|nr:complex I intermediate-associated protein CIA30 [Hymenopellis radicata]
MQSHWAKYWNRTGSILRQGIYDVVHMTGSEAPSRAARTIFSFNDLDSIREFKTGCDADIGGTSTVHFDLDETPERPATGRFWGEMSLRVQPGKEGKVRGGYAAIQNRRRPTLFGEQMEDIEHHDYLALRVRAGGEPATREAYFVNIRTDGLVQADIWQHRIFFRRSDGGWEDVYIPFANFVRTNHGQIAESKDTIGSAKLRSVNISLLGGHSNVSGKYELGIDSIRLVNEEDIDRSVTNAVKEKASSVEWEDLRPNRP